MNFSCEQLGGFGSLDFNLIEETSNWPLVVTDQTSAQIIITPYANDVEGIIDQDSINIDDNTKETAEGIVHPIVITFKFLTRSESLEQLLEQYQNKPGIVIADLNNGFRKLYGTNEEPLYMNFKVDDGQKIDDNAGVTVTIKGETRNRPVYYTT